MRQPSQPIRNRRISIRTTAAASNAGSADSTRFRRRSGILLAVTWGLFGLAALHHSRYPSLWGRYSREWLVVLGTALALALVVTLVKLSVRKERPPHNWRYVIAAVFLSGFLALGASEATMRMFDLFGSSFYTEIRRYSHVMRPDARLYYSNPVNFRGVFQHVEVATNELGLRERPLPLKSAERDRILLLGDSVAFGWGVPADRVVSRELEEELEKRKGTPAETINSGVPGFNTLQESEFLQAYGDRVQPDSVLLLYVDNDTDYLDTSKPYENRMPDPIREPLRAAGYILSGSRVLFMARHFAPLVFASFGAQQSSDRESPGWRISMQSLADIASYCRRRGIPFTTFLYRLISTPHTDRLRESLSEAAQRDGFSFCDTLPWFSGQSFRLLVNSFVDSHPNAKGHRILGEGMARFLISHPELLGKTVRSDP